MILIMNASSLPAEPANHEIERVVDVNGKPLATAYSG